jgi:Glycosyl transferase 4-like domain
MPPGRNKILVVLYSHPELYPPTLNAVINLAGHAAEVHLLYRPYKKDEWSWPPNVRLHPSGKSIGVRQFMNSGFAARMRAHARFLLDFRRLVRKVKPDMLVLYDPYPALFYRLIRPIFARKMPFLWYHSHDVIEGQSSDRIARWLRGAEKYVLDKADLFTLPAVERRPYYDLSGFKGVCFTLPNFPSRKVFANQQPRSLAGPLTLAFQGSICDGRGLEGVIESLPMQVDHRPVRFSITGFAYNSAYLDSLRRLVGAVAEKDAVVLHDAVPYGRLQETQREAHVGWAYYGMSSSMDHSIGTASNKFFEACAMGLPVLYNSNNAFEVYRRFEWALPVQPQRDSLSRQLTYIAENYEQLSTKARRQFLEELNFELAFDELIKILPHA